MDRERTGTLLRGICGVDTTTAWSILGCFAAALCCNRNQCSVRDGKRQVTDGPFAETREQLGGYFLIDAQDLDEAISIAGRLESVKAPSKFDRNYQACHPSGSGC